MATRGALKGELVTGRNPVLEALRAGVPASRLLVADGTRSDARIDEATRLAAAADVRQQTASRAELDRLTSGAVHQGIALAIRPEGNVPGAAWLISCCPCRISSLIWR